MADRVRHRIILIRHEHRSVPRRGGSLSARMDRRSAQLVETTQNFRRETFHDPWDVDCPGIDLWFCTEIDPSGSVPEIMVINKSAQSIFLIDGEELMGAKQNRVLNTSILLKKKAKALKQLPVPAIYLSLRT